MNKKRAISYFNELYDSTYNDALTYIAGKSGDTDIAEDVLFDTYAAVYAYLLKEKKVTEGQAGKQFYDALNAAIEKHRKIPTEENDFVLRSSKERISELIEKELSITASEAEENMLVKKAHSYVLQKNSTERKAFILYFYEGYSAKMTAQLLGLTEDEVYGYIEQTIMGIQNNFLTEYISK